MVKTNAVVKYRWQEAVLDAFLSPPDGLPGKINVAERGLSERLNEQPEPDWEEQLALHDALNALRVLIAESEVYASGTNR